MESEDLHEIDRMYNEAFTWSKDALRQLQKSYGRMENVEMKDVNKLNKPELANLCIRSLHFVGYLLDNVKDLRNASSSLQNRLIDSQQQIISTQAEVSQYKTEQLETLRKSVETSVFDSVKTVEASLVDSVKAELQSYSSAVLKSPPVPEYKEQTISSETLTKVVKNFVEEEDRSRNVVIFGLSEESGEVLADKVVEVFENIGQKPKVEVCRVGRKKNTDSSRPVKVKVSSSLVVQQLLANAKNLRNVAKFKTVFVCPDRSPEQRQIQRELVTEMKGRAEAEPEKRFFIRAGQIRSSEKAKDNTTS